MTIGQFTADEILLAESESSLPVVGLDLRGGIDSFVFLFAGGSSPVEVLLDGNARIVEVLQSRTRVLCNTRTSDAETRIAAIESSGCCWCVGHAERDRRSRDN